MTSPRVKPLAAYPTRRPRHLADLRAGDIAVLPVPTPPGDPWPVDWHGPCRVTYVRETLTGYDITHTGCHVVGCSVVLRVAGDTRFHGARVLTDGEATPRRPR